MSVRGVRAEPACCRRSPVCVCVCPVRDGYKVGSDVSVSLEFRTSQSEGVFLGISSAKIDAIGLEMVNGQVSVCVCVCVRETLMTARPVGGV